MWFNCPRKEGKEEEFEDQEVQKLFNEVKKDWLHLTSDAFVFVDERKKASNAVAQ